MRPGAPLESILAAGILAGTLVAFGAGPVEAQDATTAPAPAPLDSPPPPPPDRPEPSPPVPAPEVGDPEPERRRPVKPSPPPDPEKCEPGAHFVLLETVSEDRREAAESERERLRLERCVARARERGKRRRANRMRNPDGSPARSNPTLMDALPGPSFTTGVPNFVIRKFRVPVFLLPIYQAAGIQYGVRWEILAAINEIETDYGRNLNVSSAGALGWMQFIPSSWRAYGVDANKDGKKDPYNPVDAIFAAGRYLKAAGYEQDVRRAIFAYNHADWYVDSVMLRARLIAGVPADLVGSLTGLTEGRFPVAARARYADDLQEKEAAKRVKKGQNAANVIESQDNRRSVEIFARKGSPVVATNDGEIKKMGASEKLGRFIVLQDVYGNRYMYAGLGSTAKFYPVPKAEATDPKKSAKAIKANGEGARDDKPSAPASAGRQPNLDDSGREPAATRGPDAAQPSIPIKERLFAHPAAPLSRDSGGLEQLLDRKAAKGGFETYRNYFSRPFGGDSKDVRLRRLKVGSRVIGGTILGRVGGPEGTKASNIDFSIRPAGKGAPRIDPKPILDGWKLLEATAIYRASGRNVLYGDEDSDGFSIGQILLLPKPLLEKRVLSDSRIEVGGCQREDIRTGQIDRRVLATLSYLAESGLRPTVSSLKCGRVGRLTSSGRVSHHSSGNAVDIPAINGQPLLGRQEPGGITEQAVRRLMRLQGTLAPDQIISLLDFGANTLAMADHADHIHVGFRPLFGDNPKLGLQAKAVLKPGQWSDLLEQLRKIDNPVVPTKASKYAIPIKKPKRASDAHVGE